jgi:hypothetical protein
LLQAAIATAMANTPNNFFIGNFLIFLNAGKASYFFLKKSRKGTPLKLKFSLNWFSR